MSKSSKSSKHLPNDPTTLSSTLFTTILLFDTISTHKTHSKKHQSLLLQLSIERLFLITWGKTLGLLRDKGHNPRPLDARLTSIETRNVVTNLLTLIAGGFSERGGLERLRDDEVIVTREGFEWTHVNLRCLSKRLQKKAAAKKKVFWVVQDRSRFSALVKEIRGYNESLNRVLPAQQQQQQQGGGGGGRGGTSSTETMEIVVQHQTFGNGLGMGNMGNMGMNGGVAYNVNMNNGLVSPTAFDHHHHQHLHQHQFITQHGQQGQHQGGQQQQQGQTMYIPTIPSPPPAAPHPAQYLMIEAPPPPPLMLQQTPYYDDMVEIEEARHPDERETVHMYRTY
ncbi:uncharacterized protein H6S33_006890 [Morchella sextelata]|uniref:uncharacterized protein n=1 Tax=Morchella sextelata TaxID=1174677 RepID=UPI001D049F72|nr:uncharacterized protein H6S33_006890 [Morchella sextelata]KAH0604513.1 hypothetical protein H6S33_006890 [Morchella sextelata]